MSTITGILPATFTKEAVNHPRSLSIRTNIRE
jgi:hypothetical protein